MNIKSELQGAKGLLNKLRDGYMPSGNIIAHEAIKNLGYTAGAYLSLHSSIRAIIPGANNGRILGRVFGFRFHAEIRKDKDFLSLCDIVMSKRKFEEFNYGILDFGREICTPKNPKHLLLGAENSLHSPLAKGAGGI